MTDAVILRPIPRAAIGDMAALLDAPPLRGRVSVVESGLVFYLRSLAPPAGWAEHASSEAERIDGPGNLFVVGLRSGEAIVVSDDDAAMKRLLERTNETDVIVDRSHGSIVFDLRGDVDAWLARLADAAAIPRVPGRGTRLRCIDVSAVVLRLAPECAWVVVDRGVDHYVCRWLAYALDGTLSDRQ